MRTIVGKRYFQATRFTTIRDLLDSCADTYSDQDAFRYHRRPDGREIVVSFREYRQTLNDFGTGLHQIGLKDAHIGIIGYNCYEWAVAHSSIVMGVGVSVPLDRQLPQQELLHLCHSGDVKALIYHETLQDMILSVAEVNQDIDYFICMQDINDEQSSTSDPRFLTFSQILAHGRQALAAGERSFADAALDPESMVSLVFTSGTGEMSRGVMLSHRNITHNVYAVMGTLNVKPGQRALSVLPLHHTFENTVGMYMVQAFGCCICYSDGLRRFAENLKEWKINILLGVPLIFETSYRLIQKRLASSKKLKKFERWRRVSHGLHKVGIDLRRRLFRPILAGLGGELQLCVCGAAAIDREIVRFYNDIGIDFFCGYGLTETSPVISVCSTFVNHYGSVGPPVADIEVAIDSPNDRPGAIGEIITRSESVMLGYYRNPEATAAVMSPDGWFRTGDLGFLDQDDCIYITGRIKSMIVLSNGKKAFPEEIEALLNKIPGVAESLVWGEEQNGGRVDICAKLVITADKLPAGLYNKPLQVQKFMAEQVEAVNQQMPPYKEIRYFVLSRQPLLRTGGAAIRRSAEHEHIERILKTLDLDPKTMHGKWID